MELWQGYIKPFRVCGNLYFVGTNPASTHVIDTGEGLIMLDTGYQQSLYLVIHNMHLMGLNPLDIKYILHTHGHIDHMGATKELVDFTGAKTFIGEQDRDYANGTLDLTYAKEYNMEFYGTFEPDVLLNDGDIITLGNTMIETVATPGHTPGTMSYFFEVESNGRRLRAGLLGGTGLNTMSREFLDKYHLSYDCREKFVAAMERLKKEKVDIFLGNHAFQNNTQAKAEQLASGKMDAFIDSSEWSAFMEKAKQDLLQMIEKERK